MKFFLSIITLSKKQQLPYLKMKSYTLTFKKMVTNLKVLHKSIILMLGICASGKHKYFDKLMFRQIFTCLKFCFSGVFFFIFYFRSPPVILSGKNQQSVLYACRSCTCQNLTLLQFTMSHPLIFVLCFMLTTNFIFQFQQKNTYITFTLKEPFFQGEEKNNHESKLSCIRIIHNNEAKI